MIKILETLMSWTIYPVVFGVIALIYYFFHAILYFKLPDMDLKKQFMRDSSFYGLSMGEFAYVLSWMGLFMFMVWYGLFKVYNQ